MSSQSIPAEAANAYDGHSFINEDNSRREHECDSTRRAGNQPRDVSNVMLHFVTRIIVRTSIIG